MTEYDEVVELVAAEISHHISPVIGWLRMDATQGKVDFHGERLTTYREREKLAAEAIVQKLLATVWKAGYKASDAEWTQCWDLVTPDEERFVAVNPFEAPVRKTPNTIKGMEQA
jgi:beta-glucanase (GH16 family)